MQHQQADQQLQQRPQRRHGSATVEMVGRHSAAVARNSPHARQLPNSKLGHHTMTSPQVTPPIYFLVREQAKSVVAIKELKGQLETLENVQEAVFKAVHDLQASRDIPTAARIHAAALYNRDQHHLHHHHQLLLTADAGGPGGGPELFALRRNKSNALTTTPLQGVGGPHQGQGQGGVIAKSDETAEEGEGVGLLQQLVNTRPAIARYAEAMSRSNSGAHKKTKDDQFGKGDTDSENKQDSGVDSDCQNPMSLSHHQQVQITPLLPIQPIPSRNAIASSATLDLEDSQDELSVLLDVIGIKGAQLRQQIEELEQESSSNEVAYQENNNNSGLEENNASNNEVQQNKCRMLEKRLKESLSANEDMSKEIGHLRSLVERLQLDRGLLGQELERIMKDKSQLQSTIHDLHKKFFKSNSSANGGKTQTTTTADQQQAASATVTTHSSSTLIQPSQLESRKEDIVASAAGGGKTNHHIRQKCLEGSKNKVSAALKETNALELQRQLLLCIIENEVLNTKLELAEKLRLTGIKHSEKSEGKLKEDIRQLTVEKRQFSELCEQKRKELNETLDELSSARKKCSHLEKTAQELCRQIRRGDQDGDVDDDDIGYCVETMRVEHQRQQSAVTHSFIDLTRSDDTTNYNDVNSSIRRKTKACHQSLPPALKSTNHNTNRRSYLEELNMNPLITTSDEYNHLDDSESYNHLSDEASRSGGQVLLVDTHSKTSTPKTRLIKSPARSVAFLNTSPSQVHPLDADNYCADATTSATNSLLAQRHNKHSTNNSLHLHKTQLETIRLEFDPLSFSSEDRSERESGTTAGYPDSLDTRSKEDQNSSCLLSGYSKTTINNVNSTNRRNSSATLEHQGHQQGHHPTQQLYRNRLTINNTTPNNNRATELMSFED